MKKIKGNCSVEDEKRFYFDAKVKINCSNCNKELETDFNDEYLSYPKTGVQEDIGVLL